MGRVEPFRDDAPALDQIRKLKPELVVASQSPTPLPGCQLLAAAREDEATARIPFVIIAAPPGPELDTPADPGAKDDLTARVSASVETEEFARTLIALLDPLIDPKQEESFRLIQEADALAESGDLPGASEKYQKALNLHARHLDAWLSLARVLGELEQFEEAETAHLMALETDRFSLKAYFALAEYYENREEYDQAIGVLRQALGIAELIKASGRSLSRLNFFIGEFELRLKRLEAAEKSFDKAIELAPDDVKLRTDIGDAYADKGYFEESEKHFQAALDVDPNLAHVFNKLGIAYRRQKKHKKALDLYNSARRHHPDDENLMFNMARAYLAAGDTGNAVKMIEKALGIAPEFKEAKLLLAKLRRGPKKPELDQEKKAAAVVPDPS